MAIRHTPAPHSSIETGYISESIGFTILYIVCHPTVFAVLSAAGHRGIVTANALLAQEVERTGFGQLQSAVPEAGGAWPGDLRGDQHHMGTTRMHRDPKLGVVDENCRVHGVENMYVAGCSVFPTGGTFNPTLTILALALRLSDHIKQGLV
jgi:choline dehydrogenase-like flavoprotein